MGGGALLDRPCMYGLPQNVRIVPVIQVCIYVFLPYVCSHYVVSLGDFAYYVIGKSLQFPLVCCTCLPSV